MKKRLDELDLLRGLSVIGMILVITPGAWGVGYPWLNHADWEGVVAVDMIAPAFLFCIGFAIPLSLNNRIQLGVPSLVIMRQIVQRGALLILLGILIDWTGKTDFSTVRIPGVLQRIGLTFMAVSLFVLAVGKKNRLFSPSIRQLSIITAILLVSVWGLFYWVPVPGFGETPFSSDGSWASLIDQKIFGIAHMLESGKTNGIVTYDPDGLICSLSTCGNVLIGVIVGLMYQQQSPHYTPKKLTGLGIALIGLGLAFSFICPIIKNLWTSSFVLIGSGVSVLAFTLLQSIKDYRLLKILFHPLYCYGANALFGFIVSWLGMFWLLDKPIINNHSLRALGFNGINTIVPSDALASLLFSFLFIAVLYIILAYMYHKQWNIRL